MNKNENSSYLGLLLRVAAAVVLVSCSPGSSNSTSPGLRRSSAQAPCKSKTTPQKLAGSELELTSGDLKLRKKESAGEFSSGGYISMRFFGVPSGLELFKSPIQISSSKPVEFGNPSGVIDVLNIPYCTAASPNISEMRLKDCVSRDVWEKLSANQSAKKSILESPWNPSPHYKLCTARVTFDTGEDTPQNQIQRLRIWSAEHCYQAAYVTDVVLHVSLPDNPILSKIGESYISVPLHNVDGIDYVRKVVATKGLGNQSDPFLRQKLFVLRSLDGRSADTYKKALIEGCLNQRIPTGRSEQKFKYLDCFTTADISTFKASINLARLGEQNSVHLRPKERNLGAENLRQVRGTAISTLVATSRKSPSPVQKLDFSSSIPFLKRVISFEEMITSQMDGIQAARRVEAMKYEQDEQRKIAGREVFTSHQQLGAVQNFFKRADIKIGDADLDSPSVETAVNLLAQFRCHELLFDLDSRPLFCGYKMAPPDTAQLEEFSVGKTISVSAYIAKRMQVFFLTRLGNRALPDNHPLKILPTDSDALANLKMGASWTRVMFEAAVLRKNPWPEIPSDNFFRTTTLQLQKAMKSVCPASGLLAQAFPVFANIKAASGQLFVRTPLHDKGTILIYPVIEGDTTAEQFDMSYCQKVESALGESKDLIDRNLGGIKELFPRFSGVALGTDDSVFTSPAFSAEDVAYEYMARRVVYRIESASEAREVEPADSGMGWTFMGYPSFALSSHNGNLTNGAVFPDMPDINTADPDAAAPVDAQGRPIVGCDGR
jgi:hypothetical protein